MSEPWDKDTQDYYEKLEASVGRARVRLGDHGGDTLDTLTVRVAAELARMRTALSEIRVTAHCISKAGPLNTPTLADAWSKFDRISVMAGSALVPPAPFDPAAVVEAQKHNHETPLKLD